MTIELVNFWSKLTGSIHPDDEEAFQSTPGHAFNLEFPPPAFIGDVINAPVIILDNNGGYDRATTPREFQDAGAHEEFRNALHQSKPLSRAAKSSSPYYLSRNYSTWLETGQAALVNGVAYRSVSGRSAGVEKMTRTLPSARFHQNWLLRSLIPLVRRGDRFVVVHRWSRWGGACEALKFEKNAVFSTAPISKDLTEIERISALRYLESQGGAIR